MSFCFNHLGTELLLLFIQRENLFLILGTYFLRREEMKKHEWEEFIIVA